MTNIPRNASETLEQAENAAVELRRKYDLGIRGISDVFLLIEATLGYLLVRYPFGEESIQGFASVFRGERVIFTNSSITYGREIFTVAHELGHHVLDIDPNRPTMIRDITTGRFDHQKRVEFRADAFAAALLMPSQGIREAFAQYLSRHTEVTPRLVIALMVEYKVSYRALVRRLRELNLITPVQARQLRNYREHIGMNLSSYISLYGVDKIQALNLIDSSNEIHIPSQYMQALENNIRQGLIPKATLENLAEELQQPPEIFGIDLTKVNSGFESEDEQLLDFEEILRDIIED